MRGNGEHILVIDDEAQIRDLATQMLTLLGYQVSVVSSGEAAIEFLRRQQADLLLLDMVMDPGIKGCQTYLQVVALYPEKKALISSGFSASADVQRAQEAAKKAHLSRSDK